MRGFYLSVLFLLAASAGAYANAALLLEEPHGLKGKFNPTGHAAVYLSGVCADSPTHLRRCEAGEAGVVISRYKKISGYDWLAIPLIPYLYAVESIGEIPQSADQQMVDALRDRYRRERLIDFVPDDENGEPPKGSNWIQLIGAAYVRRIYAFEIDTAPEQDAAFIEEWNRRENRSHFNLLYSNCADFAASVMNFYAPHSVHRNYFADLGIMTPKQVAKSLARHARKHHELEISSFLIPQVPGSIHRSKPVVGVTETVVKSKKYVVPLAILNPTLTGTIAVAYFAKGRFDPKRNAEPFDISQAYQQAAARNTAVAESAAAPPTLEPALLEPAALAAPQAAE
jgi:hypothetical protein